jgi:hypothetical protein
MLYDEAPVTLVELPNTIQLAAESEIGEGGLLQVENEIGSTEYPDTPLRS